MCLWCDRMVLKQPRWFSKHIEHWGSGYINRHIKPSLGWQTKDKGILPYINSLPKKEKPKRFNNKHFLPKVRILYRNLV